MTCRADRIADGGEGVGREMEEEDAKGMNSFSHNYKRKRGVLLL